MNCKKESPRPTFKEYPVERLMIDSLRSRLDASEDGLRMEIMNRIIDGGGPLPVAELLKGSSEETARVFQQLQEKQVVVLDESGEDIQFVYPISSLPTPHRVTLADGRSFFSMCAIDSIGAAFTLNQNTSVRSQCSACGTPISLSVHNGQLIDVQPDSLHIIHVDLNKSENWASSC